jgi:hypothetical protein
MNTKSSSNFVLFSLKFFLEYKYVVYNIFVCCIVQRVMKCCVCVTTYMCVCVFPDFRNEEVFGDLEIVLHTSWEVQGMTNQENQFFLNRNVGFNTIFL